jgi:hypothetical protein
MASSQGRAGSLPSLWGLRPVAGPNDIRIKCQSHKHWFILHPRLGVESVRLCRGPLKLAIVSFHAGVRHAASGCEEESRGRNKA